MKRFVAFLLVVFTFFTGCEVLSSILAPLPTDYYYYYIPLKIYVKSINRGSDTLHVISVKIRLKKVVYARPSNPPHDDRFYFSYDIKPHLSLELAYDDTSFHEFQAAVPRFIGYQISNSSDTTRLSTLDNYDGWHMKLQCDSTFITYVRNTDTLKVCSEGFLKTVPDTLRNGALDLNLIVDWSNLLEEREGHIYVNPEALYFTEI